MPNVDVHCKISKERTGEEFRKLHEWMDEPGELLGIDHRRVRHDLSYIDEVKKLFGEKYGKAQAVKEFLLHIADDYLASAEKWGRPCKTPGCKNNTYHKNKYCNTCIKNMKWR